MHVHSSISDLWPLQTDVRWACVNLLPSPCLSQQGYVLSTYNVPIRGQSGRIFPEVCQEGEAEAVAEFVPVPLSGQTHRAHAAAAAQG